KHSGGPGGGARAVGRGRGRGGRGGGGAGGAAAGGGRGAGAGPAARAPPAARPAAGAAPPGGGAGGAAGAAGPGGGPRVRWRADVVVCAGWYAPSGVTALEAMAAGLPVVATAIGGQRDVVIDGVTGALVPPGAPGALARAVRRVLADPIRQLEYAAAGLDRVR